jgi:DNA-binding IclR family transcriptional regulator
MQQQTDASARKTVDKAMQVLNAFTHERNELAIGELARELGMHKSVVSRLVSALRRWRILEQDPDTRLVRVGVGAFRLGSIFATRQNIVRVVTPYLGALVARTGHSAHAVLLDGNRGLVVATVESPHALRVIMRVGEHRPLHSTASGKVFLALGDPALLLAVEREHGLGRYTAGTITDPARLRAQLTRIRREGIAWNEGENHTGAGGVSAAVLDEGGNVVAAISSVFPLNVVDAAERAALGKETRLAARRASQAFAASPEGPGAPPATGPRARRTVARRVSSARAAKPA